MPIKEHPPKGSILMCNFDQGFRVPEMIKKRPVIVISPRIRQRHGLCTVVALSTTEPYPVMPYHVKISLPSPVPEKLNDEVWVKGDMVNAVGFHRLDFIRVGREISGKRAYYYASLDEDQMLCIHRCVLNGLGLLSLTKHL